MTRVTLARPALVHLALAGLTIVGVAALVLAAGPLNPPAGAVTSTYKTLSEVEPRTAINVTNTPGVAAALFRIAQPGSYYLTGNITGVANKHGIEIMASGVTLDLNGFELVGVAGSRDGVSATSAELTNIAVVNGSVRNWGGDGVDLATSGVINYRVVGVLASGNDGFGIATASGGTVTSCSAYENTGHGISTSNGSMVTNCSVTMNGASGISTGSGCGVLSCAALLNAARGITVGSGSTVADCTAQQNALDGIVCTFNCVIRGNTCSFNGTGGDGAGVHATSSANRIEGNTCTSADRGIDVDGVRNVIIRNTCSGNTNNWDVVAGNVILVVNAATAGVVTGNSGGVAPGSTDPNANFTY
ncbi:MAG: right-handed parallel beta-helix repeat-containing protein [Planctomycetota bacterium]